MLCPVELRALCRHLTEAAGFPAIARRQIQCGHARQLRARRHRFSVPGKLALEEADHDAGWAVTVQSRDTAFLTLSYHADQDDLAVLADSVLTAFREEYKSVECDRALETIAGVPAVGYDFRFISMDLTNTAWVRALACEDGCLLILCEINDLELDSNGPVLKAISKSLTIDD